MTDWQKRVSKIEVGDKVAYKASFLRSTGQYSGDLPHARGTVTELTSFGGGVLVTIDWGNPDIPAKVLAANLSKVTERGIAEE